MKVSINQIKQYIDFELPPVDELVDRINRQLGGVEEVINLGERYQDAVIVKVVSAEKHPNADRLTVTKIDDDGVREDLPRDGDGLVQVVCGAPNVQAGMFAVWLPPASVVPASFDDTEPFMLGSRELRGVVSHGMLAAADELAIGSDHDGIVEVTEKDIMPQKPNLQAPTLQELVGQSFAAAFGLDDTIIDIENKMFTHRPDLFGQLGVAREIAGILGHHFISPDWYINTPEFASGEGLELEVFNEASEKVPRFMAVAMKNITVGPSPLWLQCALVAMGSKPINNIVDVTNYIMLLTAQPTHAYDYDKLRGHTLGARMAKGSETVKLLNNKTYELSEDDIVIADDEGAVGLAGIMGGGESEVDENTTNIVLEVATFDMYTVRKSSMRHGVFTDALTRFNKGQSPLQNDRVLARLMQFVTQTCGAQPASQVFDTVQSDNGQVVSVTDDFINQRLGLDLDANDIDNLLSNVEFSSVASGADDTSLDIVAPFWRTDIEEPEDIVEEVGRLYGFDKLPRELPQRSAKPAPKNHRRQIKQRLRTELTRAGAHEVLTYSFASSKVMKNAQQTADQAFKITNALSPDLEYYRLSLAPSLLDKIHMNIKAGHSEFLLYEIGKAHHKDAVAEDGLPAEMNRIAGVYASKLERSSGDGAPYYVVKSLCERLFQEFGVTELRYQPLQKFDYGPHDMLRQLAAPFDDARSAMLWIDDKFAGVIGEYKTSVKTAFKLPSDAAGFELFLSPFEKATTGMQYRPLSKYPALTQDISLKISSDISYQELYDVVHEAVEKKSADVTMVVQPLDIYQPVDDTATKTVTFRLTATSHERTLRDDEVSEIRYFVEAQAAAMLDAATV